MVHTLLATPPTTPICLQEGQISSEQPVSPFLQRLEQRITALEIQNASLITQIEALHQSQSHVNLKGDTYVLPASSYQSPSLPSSHASLQSESTEVRCLALAKRVQALQSQLNQCVDACASALDLERNMRNDVELDNLRLAEEIRVLRQEKGNWERQVKRYKRMALSYQPPQCDREGDEDCPHLGSAHAQLLQISKSSDAAALVEDQAQVQPTSHAFLSGRKSWFLSSYKQRSMPSLDLSHLANSLRQFSQGEMVNEQDEQDPSPTGSNETIVKRSSDVMKKAVHRASLLLSDIVRTYGDLPIVEGVVL